MFLGEGCEFWGKTCLGLMFSTVGSRQRVSIIDRDAFVEYNATFFKLSASSKP